MTRVGKAVDPHQTVLYGAGTVHAVWAQWRP
jgi:hypothetical protein